MLATARPQATAIARSVLFSIIRPARVGRLPRQPVVRHRIPPIIPSVPGIWRANATVSPIVTPSETVRARLRTRSSTRKVYDLDGAPIHGELERPRSLPALYRHSRTLPLLTCDLTLTGHRDQLHPGGEPRGQTDSEFLEPRSNRSQFGFPREPRP